MTLAVRRATSADVTAATIRAEVLAVDPDQRVYNVRPMHAAAPRTLALRRFQNGTINGDARGALGNRADAPGVQDSVRGGP